MARKLEIKKIEQRKKLQLTYVRRRQELMRKAFEVSMLCDVDIAVIMFSPSGRLALFSNDSIEEIISRFVDTPVYLPPELERNDNFLESLKKAKLKLDMEREVVTQQQSLRHCDTDSSTREVQELKCTLEKAIMEKEYFEKKASLFDGLGEESLEKLTSTSQLTAIEREIERALEQIRERKQRVALNELMSSQQDMYTLQHASIMERMREAQSRGGTSHSTSDQLAAQSNASTIDRGQSSHIPWLDHDYRKQQEDENPAHRRMSVRRRALLPNEGTRGD